MGPSIQTARDGDALRFLLVEHGLNILSREREKALTWAP